MIKAEPVDRDAVLCDSDVLVCGCPEEELDAAIEWNPCTRISVACLCFLTYPRAPSLTNALWENAGVRQSQPPGSPNA
jgi:hypothetical protein